MPEIKKNLIKIESIIKSPAKSLPTSVFNIYSCHPRNSWRKFDSKKWVLYPYPTTYPLPHPCEWRTQMNRPMAASHFQQVGLQA